MYVLKIRTVSYTHLKNDTGVKGFSPITASLLNVVLATFAAYALSRFRFRGKAFYTCIIFVTQVLPQVVIVVPVFMMMQKMDLYNTYTGVILTILATSMAFPILLMRSFFDSVPFAMEEAAAIDGCSRFMTLIRVIIPMTLPGKMCIRDSCIGG